MLRITRLDGNTGTAATLRLEGKLLGPWVDELVQASAALPRVRLDLSAVSFVDAAGMRALRELVRHGATVAACSGFVAELLQREKP